MKLIIKNENFDTKRIYFKNNKNGIKLLYSVHNIFTVGIPLKIEYDKLIIKDYIILVSISKKHIDIINKIDHYFADKVNNYVTFLHNEHSLKIKKHGGFIVNTDKLLSFTINCIRSYKGNNYVQLFTI